VQVEANTGESNSEINRSGPTGNLFSEQI